MIIHFFNSKIFEYKHIRITVRDVFITMVILLLLFFGLRGCQDERGVAIKKVEMIEEVCTFTNRNLSDLQDLLERADLCSKQWFSDFDEYMQRIEEQNNLLKNKTNIKHKEVYKLQVELLKSLHDFKDKQEDTTITALEKTVEKYQKKQNQLCQGEGVTKDEKDETNEN